MHPLPHSDYCQILIITSMPPYLMTPAMFSWSSAASAHCKLQQEEKKKNSRMRVHVTWKRLSELKTQAIWIIQSSPSHFEQEGWKGSSRPSENLWTIAQDVIMLTEQPPQKRYRIFHAILQHCIVFRAYSRAKGTLWMSALPYWKDATGEK